MADEQSDEATERRSDEGEQTASEAIPTTEEQTDGPVGESEQIDSLGADSERIDAPADFVEPPAPLTPLDVEPSPVASPEETPVTETIRLTEEIRIGVPLPCVGSPGYSPTSPSVKLTGRQAETLNLIGQGLKLTDGTDRSPRQVIGWILDQVRP
jgi:hypothetical protein